MCFILDPGTTGTTPAPARGRTAASKRGRRRATSGMDERIGGQVSAMFGVPQSRLADLGLTIESARAALTEQRGVINSKITQPRTGAPGLPTIGGLNV